MKKIEYVDLCDLSMKIGIFHPALMDYRLELFTMVNGEYDVTFVFTKQGRGQDNIQENHLSIPINWKYKILKTNVFLRNRDVGMYAKLIKEILFGKYDVLIVSNNWYMCWPIVKLTKKKYIFWTESWYWKDSSFLRKCLNWYTKFIYKHSDAIITSGTKACEAQLNIGVSEKKIFTYPQCAVDYSTLSLINLRKQLNLENKKIILFVGRLVPLKGLDVLIKSFSLLNNHLKDIHLIIIGSGPYETDYKKLALDYSVENISFIGAVNDNEIKASFYEMCDVFVLPSIFYGRSYEPWGLVINETMAFGKPIITTVATGAGFDLVRNDYNGFIVEDNNVHELYHALYEILSDDRMRTNMGINSKTMFMEKNNYLNMFKVFSDAINYVSNQNKP